MQEACYWVFCFVPPPAQSAGRIFGFGEFVAALALLVVLYTIADVRYKFRLRITPGRLDRTTYGVIAFVGISTLLTDLWIAEHWWRLHTVGLTVGGWQAIAGGLFLGTALTWMYYAFLNPPVFSRRNARSYAGALYQVVLKGNGAELAVIANELARSAKPLVKWSRSIRMRHEPEEEDKRIGKRDREVAEIAYQVLLLIANRKLCHHIVESTPVTALEFFKEMHAQRRFNVPLDQFARAVSSEAIANKNSILHHEGDGFHTGLLGYLRPWSKTIYGHYELVEALATRNGSPLDVHYREVGKWDAEQWEVFARAVLATLDGYLSSELVKTHSYAIYRAFSEFEQALWDVRKLDGREVLVGDEGYEKLRVVVQFIEDAIELVEKQPRLPPYQLRVKKSYSRDDVFDLIAHLMFKVLDAASCVAKPVWTSWSIQHNATWSKFFGYTNKSKAWRIAQFKLRRLLCNEVTEIGSHPNYQNVRILGLILNITGFAAEKTEHSTMRGYWPIAKMARALARRHYLEVRAEYPDVANALLIGGLSFDVGSQRLVKTYEGWLGKEPTRKFLECDRPKARRPNAAPVEASPAT